MSCEKCELLLELYNQTPKLGRDYWVMTELFVHLHGSDVCNSVIPKKPYDRENCSPKEFAEYVLRSQGKS